MFALSSPRGLSSCRPGGRAVDDARCARLILYLHNLLVFTSGAHVADHGWRFSGEAVDEAAAGPGREAVHDGPGDSEAGLERGAPSVPILAALPAALEAPRDQ